MAKSLARPGATAALTTITVLALGCGSGYEVDTAEVTGTITVNGEPVEGLVINFVPEAKMRPSTGVADTSGHYSARFTKNQSGVVPGPCVVEFAYYPGDAVVNALPETLHAKASENPDLCVDVPADGLVFDYDIEYDGDIRK